MIDSPTTQDTIKRFADEFQSQYGRQPYILDLIGVAPVPNAVLFSPPSKEIHYFDKTIDAVICRSADIPNGIERVSRHSIFLVREDGVEVKTLNAMPPDLLERKSPESASSSNGQKVLLIAPVLPEHDRESGSRRIWHLIKILINLGYGITYATEKFDRENRYVRQLLQLGIVVESLDTLPQLLKESKFHFAIIAFWNLAQSVIPLVRELSPDTRLIVDSVDLHFLRESRAMFIEFGKLLPSFSSISVREINTYLQADNVLTVSKKEAAILNELSANPSKAVEINLYEDFERSERPYRDRRGILFIGNFRHSPNLDAVRFLTQAIYPKLDRTILDQHPIYIIGNAPSPDVLEIVQGHENIHLVGWVPSVKPYLERSVAMIAPMRFGAGTNRKIMESLLIGTPCVSTSIGAEGFGLDHEENILIADNPTDFAFEIARLISNEELWHRLAENGRSHMLSSHSFKVVRDQVRRVLNALGGTPSRVTSPVPRFFLQSTPIKVTEYPDHIDNDMTLEIPSVWEGVCNLEGERTVFTVRGDNLRETVHATTGTFNRQRQLICGLSMAIFGVPHATLKEVCDYLNSNKYTLFIAEANGAIFEFLRGSLHRELFYFSEFFGQRYASGESVDGIRNEDLQDLSFGDGKFDIVITADILEHVPKVIKAEDEIIRVLKPGGCFCFTVPIDPKLKHDLIKAERRVDGTIEYLAEPEFHGDPLRSKEGILVYRAFSHHDLRQRFEGRGCDYSAFCFSSFPLGIINRHNHTVQVVQKLA